ncbi:MAG: nuclear transport factor 2 family protein [Gemmatimonadota bacterium]
MTITLRCAATAFVLHAAVACAVSAQASDSTSAVQLQQRWWRAFAVADTATVRARSTANVFLTLSTGESFAGDAVMRQAASNSTTGGLVMTFSDERVRFATPTVAVVTTRVSEVAGPTTSVLRFMTVLERGAEGWRVAAAQSTRELLPSPRRYGADGASGTALADYVGAYRTPRGLALRIQVRDSTLAMIEPSGREILMEPVGPGLFELAGVSPANGLVRLLFTRDAAGRVTALSQLVTGAVNTYPRIP